jgi:hypothetical protein
MLLLAPARKGGMIGTILVSRHDIVLPCGNQSVWLDPALIPMQENAF